MYKSFGNSQPPLKPTFVDAFAGCGGLSLGLMKAGWSGLFAIEKDRFAFDSLKANFLSERGKHRYDWPDWLSQVPADINELMGTYHRQLGSLKGKIDLLAGGPPCQGFSSAGRRDPDDPRNKMVEAYIELVFLLEPDMVLLENVRGFTYDFAAEETENYASHLEEVLKYKYHVFSRLLTSSNFGIPQKRPRFFFIALKKGIERNWVKKNPFSFINMKKKEFLADRGVPIRPNSRLAISDLEVGRNGTVDCSDTLGYQAINYLGPKTGYQRLMRDGHVGLPSGTRLAKHRVDIAERFRVIIHRCNLENRLNVAISKELRAEFGLKKQAIRVMDPMKPAPTITSMPDDLLHYKEARTLTVRENARLQSFPDWFEFKGKYTTGGHLRKLEIPRFTQVANAVPPLLAELIGESLKQYLPLPNYADNLNAAE